MLITGPEIFGNYVDFVYRVRSFRQVRRRTWRSRQEVEFAVEATALEELAWHEVGRRTERHDEAAQDFEEAHSFKEASTDGQHWQLPVAGREAVLGHMLCALRYTCLNPVY